MTALVTSFNANEDEQLHNNLVKLLMLLEVIPYNNDSIDKYYKGPKIYIPGAYGFYDIAALQPETTNETKEEDKK
jgi:hypothetical protein